MKPTFKSALLLAATVATLFTSVAASAGDMTLYSRPGFDGREVTLREATTDLVGLGFNDRASSMVVRGGRWEVCVDANFQGGCKVFEPGEYPTLDGLNDRISSAREVGRAGGERGDHGGRGRVGHGRRGMLELFTQPGQGGNSTRLVRDTEDFERIGFNDRTFSVIVEEGTWQLCVDADFRGTCRLFGPGRHPDLGRELSGRVSSARLVDQRAEQPPRQDDMAPVLLFAEGDLRGRPLGVQRDEPDLVPLGFNDKAASIIVNEGRWEFCMHANFGGRCVVYGPGRYPRLDGMNQQISSVRRVR